MGLQGLGCFRARRLFCVFGAHAYGFRLMREAFGHRDSSSSLDGLVGKLC